MQVKRVKHLDLTADSCMNFPCFAKCHV